MEAWARRYCSGVSRPASCARSAAKSSARGSKTCGMAPHPDQAARMRCSGRVAGRPASRRVCTSSMAARLARARAFAPEGTRTSVLAGKSAVLRYSSATTAGCASAGSPAAVATGGSTAAVSAASVRSSARGSAALSAPISEPISAARSSARSSETSSARSSKSETWGPTARAVRPRAGRGRSSAPTRRSAGPRGGRVAPSRPRPGPMSGSPP